MEQENILILSEAFGVGHTKAAEALKEGILHYQPHWQVDVLELGVWLSPYLSRFLSELYIKTLQYSPRLWGMMYRTVQNRPVMPKTEFLLHRILYTKIAHLIKLYQPSRIICTHPFPSAVISRLKRIGINIPLFTVITDYTVHGSWISSGVDKYFLPSSKLVVKMRHLGVPLDKIVASGIPLPPKFWTHQDKSTTRKKLGLKEAPTLLCMGGGLGLGLSIPLLKALFQFRKEIQIIVITGKNKALYHSIKETFEHADSPLHLYSFVDNIHEFMDASDLLITKPGGMTCSEAIAKGLPMLLLNPIPGQEEHNLQYLKEEQMAVPISNVYELELFLQQMSQNWSQVLQSFRFSIPFAGNHTAYKLTTKSPGHFSF